MKDREKEFIFNLAAAARPEFRDLFLPRRTATPTGYHPSVELAHDVLELAMTARTNAFAAAVQRQPVPTVWWAAYTCTLEAVRYSMPTYYVGADLMRAMVRTSPPADMPLSELRWPMPAMIFMLHERTAEELFGLKIPFAVATRISSDWQASLPCGDPFDLSQLTGKLPPGGHSLLTYAYDEGPRETGAVIGSAFPLSSPLKETFSGVVLKETPFLSHSGGICQTEVRPGEAHVTELMSRLVYGLILSIADRIEVTGGGLVRPARVKRGVLVKDALFSPRWIGELYRLPRGPSLGGHHASPAAHWRSGHWRAQHYGKGNELIKQVWIEPVMVMGEGS